MGLGQGRYLRNGLHHRSSYRDYTQSVFFSSAVRGPQALEAFDKSMGSPPPLLGADIGFGAGSAFCVSGRDSGAKRDGVVLRILACYAKLEGRVPRVIHIWANRANSIGRLS